MKTLKYSIKHWWKKSDPQTNAITDILAKYYNIIYKISPERYNIFSVVYEWTFLKI